MNEQILTIPARLKNVSKGGHVAGTIDIIDDNLGMTQDEINTETYSLINDVNERLSGLSPDQQGALNVATKATNNETKLGYYVCDTESNVATKIISNAIGYILSNGGSIKVKMTNANSASDATLNINNTGAKPLYYDGKRASVNNTWEEGETVEVYYDGTNYYANNVAGGSSDGVLDVSIKYPTSGIEGGNTYTLEGALSVLNTNFFSNKKKGGMSIKFIQNPDNKYVQYRLMATSFSIIENDWQGVDDEPVADSNNLVKSGGVAAVSGYYIENPEFVQVKLDAEDKILEAIREDGTKVLAAGAEIYGKTRMHGEIETNGSVETVIDNPEFAAVWVDAENKILFAIMEDGDILYGCGVPSQIKAYIDEKIREVSPEEVLEIMDFLDGLQEGSKNLRTLLNEKVDKEEGKSLIDAEYASSCSTIENPEFIEVKTDAEDKILEATKEDGTKVIYTDFQVLGEMEVSGVKCKVVENPEYLAAWVDAEDKLIFGLKSDGKTFIGDADFLDDIKNIKEVISNIKSFFDYYNVSKHHSYKEYFDVYTVNEGWEKIAYNSSLSEYDPLDVYQIGEQCNFGGDTANSYQATTSHRGVAPATISQDYILRPAYTLQEALDAIPSEVKNGFFAGQVICFVNRNSEIEAWELQLDNSWEQKMPMMVENPEFMDVETDSEGKILSSRDNKGVKKEYVSFETPKINLEGATIENKANPEYIEAKIDTEDKLLEGTKTDGTKVIGGNLEVGGNMKIVGEVNFTNGIPQEIVDYVAANTGSGVSNIEYEGETGDMYATYDEADGVTDVCMEDNGDIYVEIEE